MVAITATFLIAAASLLAWFDRRANPSSARMLKLVPPADADASTPDPKARYLLGLHRVLKIVDPTFASSETMLRSLGVTSLEWLVSIEAGKILGALLAAFVTAKGVGALGVSQLVTWIAPIVTGIFFFVLVNMSIRNVSLNRRRAIRRELALGNEILCIFLEGGQSLDQAFRSFCDMCERALPRIADIQRALVADINNGVPYEKAIGRWVENLNIDEAKPLGPLFIDSLVHGSELVPHLRQFSADLVEQRVATARASIGVKSSQLTVVMVLFFLPAILAFVMAPAVTALTHALELSR